MIARSGVRAIAAALLLSAVLASATTIHAAHPARSPASDANPLAVSPGRFDKRTFEQYVRAHHHRDVTYLDRTGRVLPIPAAWMSHRRMCGGVMAPVVFNRATGSVIQAFQGCWAQIVVTDPTVRFHPAPWLH